jgi:hypothetical protein
VLKNINLTQRCIVKMLECLFPTQYFPGDARPQSLRQESSRKICNAARRLCCACIMHRGIICVLCPSDSTPRLTAAHTRLAAWVKSVSKMRVPARILFALASDGENYGHRVCPIHGRDINPGRVPHCAVLRTHISRGPVRANYTRANLGRSDERRFYSLGLVLRLKFVAVGLSQCHPGGECNKQAFAQLPYFKKANFSSTIFNFLSLFKSISGVQIKRIFILM